VTDNGQTFVGIRGETGGTLQPFTWTNLSGHPGYPGTAIVCSTSVVEHGQGVVNPVRIDVLTTTGLVYETGCTVTPGGDALDCDNNPWIQLTTP
jgi:hypothetical protein